MDSTLELINHANPTTIFIIIILAILAIKEIWTLISWFVGKFRGWHNKESEKEDKEESTEDRIKRLENHDLKQYERLENMDKTLNQVTDVLANLQITVRDMRIDDLRKTLLDFASGVGAGRRYSKEQYDEMLILYDDYERILAENGLTNGRVSVSMDIVRDKYKYNLINKGFIEDTFMASVYDEPKSEE